LEKFSIESITTTTFTRMNQPRKSLILKILNSFSNVKNLLK